MAHYPLDLTNLDVLLSLQMNNPYKCVGKENERVLMIPESMLHYITLHKVCVYLCVHTHKYTHTLKKHQKGKER